MDCEACGVKLGWRVMGARLSDAASKYRRSFALSNVSTYWPWSHEFDHPHGSLPAPSPLLNFDPSWTARKPYACQLCYNSNHSTFECPLPGLKLGGVPLVGASSHTLASVICLAFNNKLD